MIKINIIKYLPIVISSFIGIGIGVIVALWFRLPSHTVDVFAFVESTFGIVLASLTLLITMGALRLKADFEVLIATKRDEMVAEAVSKLEAGAFQVFRQEAINRNTTIESTVHSLENAWNNHWSNTKNTRQ